MHNHSEWRIGLLVDDPETEARLVDAVVAAGSRAERIRSLESCCEAVAAGRFDAVFVAFPPSSDWTPFLSECCARIVCVWVAAETRVDEAYARGLVGGTGDTVHAHAVLLESNVAPREIRRAMLAGLHVRRLQAATRESTLASNEAAALARFVVESSSAVVFRWRPASGSPVRYVSDNVRLFGYTPDEMTARGFFYQSILHPEDLEATLREIKQCRERSIDAFTLTYRILTRDGEVRWVEDHTSVVRDADNVPIYHQGVVMDVTARRDAQQQLQKLSQAVEQSPGAIAIADLRGRIEYINPRFAESSGHAARDIVGRELLGFNLDGDTAAHKALWSAVWRGDAWRGEVRKRRRDGEPYWELASVSPIRGSSGNITHFIEVGEDITDRRRAEATIRQMAFYDALTQLPNRALFQERLVSALARARRDGRIAAVLFLDLDKFKQVNDTQGHAVGDELLRQVAARLRAAVREGDTVARMAGDEFLVLLPSLEQAAHAGGVARKIIAAIAAPFDLDGRQHHTATSVGISVFPGDGESPDDLLRHADAAMYASKQAGGSRFTFHTDPDAESSARKVTLRDLLVNALVRNEFELHYHPVIDLARGTVVGLEALLRWNHPDRGSMQPADTFALADGAGLAAELDRWVVRTACQAARRWHETGLPAVRVACNIAPRQVGSIGFVSRILEAIEAAPSGLGGLELEFDARDLASAGDAGRAALTDLRAAGVRIAIGGVGQAEWSLNGLRSLAVDAIKLERDLTRQLTTSREAAALVRGLVNIAQTMQVDCVAQGVETRETLDVLRDVGCRYAQGFAMSLPLREHELAELFGRREPEWSGSVTGIELLSRPEDEF